MVLPGESGKLLWSLEQRMTNYLLRTAYYCNDQQIYEIMHLLNPDWVTKKESSRSVSKIRDDYASRGAKGRSMMWAKVVKTHYTPAEVKQYQTLKQKVEDAAEKCGIDLFEIHPPPPVLSESTSYGHLTPSSSFTAGESAMHSAGTGQPSQMSLSEFSGGSARLEPSNATSTAMFREVSSKKRRCKRCKRSKKGCDGRRPCYRCNHVGIDYSGCISDGEEDGGDDKDENQAEERNSETTRDRSKFEYLTGTFPFSAVSRSYGTRTGHRLGIQSNFRIDKEDEEENEEDDEDEKEKAEEEELVENAECGEEESTHTTRRSTRTARGQTRVSHLEFTANTENYHTGNENSAPQAPQDGIEAQVLGLSTIVRRASTSAPKKLRMVHFSHLTWENDRVTFMPVWDQDEAGITYDGYINPDGTHKAIYDYGGPVYLIRRCENGLPGESIVELRKEDVMVCVNDFCSVCCRRAYRPVVPAPQLSRYRGLGFVHLHRDCERFTEGIWQFRQREGQAYDLALNGTATATIEFSDGQRFPCCVCGENCSICSTGEYAYTSTAFDEAMAGRHKILRRLHKANSVLLLPG